jgi:putative transposase
MTRRGRYGVPMQVYGSMIPGGPTLARLLPRLAAEGREEAQLSRDARRRLRAIRWYEEHGRNASLAARRAGYSRSTFYVWLKRYGDLGPKGLEDRSHRPHKVRAPTWSPALAAAVRELREAHPRWGKDKLAVLLRGRGFEASVSMVGRILTALRKAGQMPLADLRDPWMPRRHQTRPYAVRKPRDYVPVEPGDLVQIDSADVRLLPGSHWYKHFTARDVVSRWDVLGVYGRATAITARDFLADVLQRMPYPVRAIQVDGGSEFMAEFEEACREHGLKLFVLPPRSPKLNGQVERAQRTHKEEFYQMLDPPDSLAQLRERLRAQEVVYNTVRPHQALGQRTPQQFYDDWLTHHERR